MQKIFGFINTRLDVLASAVSVVLIVCIALFVHFIAPPETFPLRVIVTVEEGETLSEIGRDLEQKGIIASAESFILFTTFFYGDMAIAGDYFFERPTMSFQIANRIARGDYGLSPTRVTVPEGLMNRQVADILALRLSEDFDTEHFLELAEGKEGYLFPETYFFLQNVSPEDVIEAMESTFEERLKEIETEINSFGRSLDEIVVMASILEEEAGNLVDRQAIASVLWKRIEIGMPLQVDAAFQKVEEADGRNTYELTKEDLRAESPFNTYKNPGLPPSPITNPGFNSLKAAVTPLDNEYLFYVSDRRGNLYFAEDFEGHKINISKHL